MTLLDTNDSATLCLGVDPSQTILAAWGCADSAQGVSRFADRILDRIDGIAKVIKPQIAYFERFGSEGVATAQRLCTSARENGTLVILDAKRGDIPETNAAYASAYLERGAPFEVDGLTISPYLGVSSLEPFIQSAVRTAKALYLVLKSSNPAGREVQDQLADDGEPIWQHVLDLIKEWPNHLGVVVGASDPDLAKIASQIPGRPLLIPGVGAQGGSLSMVRESIKRSAAVVNMSRGLLLGGPDELRDRMAAAQRDLQPTINL